MALAEIEIQERRGDANPWFPSYEPMEFHWFSISVGDAQMQQINVNSFYLLGAKVARSWRDISSPRASFNERFQGLAEMYACMEIFLDRSADTTWRSTRHRAQQIVDHVKSCTVFQQPNTTPDAEFVEMLEKMLRMFESTFASEAMHANVFSVSRKGTHSPLDLMEHATENLPASVVSRLSDETKLDINDAGRCLALDCHTACGYHILRAVERQIIKYTDKVTATVTLKKQPRDWGGYITALENNGGNAEVIGYLKHIKGHYRNPIIHPEDTLTADDALALFGACLSAIQQLDDAIEAWP